MEDVDRHWILSDYSRGGILFNRADFTNLPYGVKYELPVVLGTS